MSRRTAIGSRAASFNKLRLLTNSFILQQIELKKSPTLAYHSTKWASNWDKTISKTLHLGKPFAASKTSFLKFYRLRISTPNHLDDVPQGPPHAALFRHFGLLQFVFPRSPLSERTPEKHAWCNATNSENTQFFRMINRPNCLTCALTKMIS